MVDLLVPDPIILKQTMTGGAPEPIPEHSYLKHLTILFGVLAVGFSLAGLFAARFGIALGISMNPGDKMIALSAALTWIILGSILAYQSAKPFRRFSMIIVQAGLIFIAAAASIEFVFNILGDHSFIEKFFISAGMAILGPSSSHVSPVAVSLAVPAALAVASLIRHPGISHTRTQKRDIVSLLGFVISVISITFVLSYAYNNPLLYGTEYIPIAFISALAAFFIGASIITAAGPFAFPVRYIVGNSTSARLLRVFVPLVAGIVVSEYLIFIGLSSWFSVHNAILISAILVIFIFITALVVARVSGGIGRALEEAQNELIRKSEDLGNLNEELSASEEELQQNIDKLTRAESSLNEANKVLEQRVAERTALLENAVKETGAERQRLYDVLETLPVYVCLLDGNYHMPFANKYFRETFGKSEGRRCYEFLFSRTVPCETCETYTVMRTRAPHHWYWTGPNNKDYDIYDFPFIDTNGSLLILEMGIDITETKKAVAALREANDLLEIRVQERTKELRQKNIDLGVLNEELTATQEELQQNVEELMSRESQLNDALAEKEILLSEIHHRVKNNLAAFISLLGLEGAHEVSAAGKSLKKDLQNRARSMALIHETLYKTHRYSEVDMEVYLSTLIDQVVDSYRSVQSVRTVVEAKGVALDLAQATPTGLIVNELITNSLKYAFPPEFDCLETRGEPCTIHVSLVREDGTHLLIVSDNGCGLPAGLDPLATKSLGLKLVNFLARHQLQAEIAIRTDKGTEFIFRLNKREV